MEVSEARLAANRMNSRMSTGPRTSEGKSISRQNSLKHGLTGEGVVVPEGDREEIERRVEALEADFDPKSPVGAMMIRRMATLSVRAEKAAEQETAATAERVRNAVDTFDDGRFDKADALFDALPENPRTNLRKLKRMPEGVDRLIDAWNDLRDNLTREARGSWTAEHLAQAAVMTGTRPENARISRIGDLSHGVWGDFRTLADREGGELDDEARKKWARARLVERIDAEIADLKAHRETLDFETLELDRIEAPARALFDSSKPAILARRYEAGAERSFFKSLKELRESEAEFAARSESAPSLPNARERFAPDPRMGSFGASGPPAGPGPAWAPMDAPMAEIPVVRSPEGKPLVYVPPVKSTT